MAAVHQETKGGQEPNANSTPRRRRNANAIVAVVGGAIVLALIGVAVGSRDPGAGMGGHVSNQASAPRSPPSDTP